ncbi:MAG TPA: phospho-sugar mutase [Pseudonocardia sp.]|nr:phospho-sugar mutase [Pseudonocardia sp.]
MSLAPALRDAALRWIADDPDPATRTELQRLLATALAGGPADELAERMAGMLRFGTAGLRGPVRAGPAGMNVAVVRRATAGLASWLVAHGHGGGTVVVGRDARHGSAEFAVAASEVLAGAGFQVTALAAALPTPVLAYAVRARGAVAGVQVTASHNPPADNGYKVYLADGAQLVEPSDAEIEAAIAAAPAAVSIDTTPVSPTDPAELLERYLDRVARLPRGTARGLRIALTPMHGVGGAVAVHALRLAGFDDVYVVRSQAVPDPDFPTVAFPNPEEPGATDALLALAAEVGADLAVALDPDADRCALGVPDPTAPGGWRMLTGNETGALLGDHVLATLDRAAHPDPLVATTVASSTQLRAVAAARGARFAETLTGFKWIVRAGGAGADLVFGFEEALGYCVDPAAVRDKDGIAAAVLAADLAATRRAAGGSLLDALDELALAHGIYLTAAVTILMAPDERAAVLAKLAAEPPAGTPTRPDSPPPSDSPTPQGAAPTVATPPAAAPLAGATLERPAPDVFVLRGERTRAVIRPSGTEPKLKAYLEVVEPPPEGPAGLPGARDRASHRLDALRTQVRALLNVPDEHAAE